MKLYFVRKERITFPDIFKSSLCFISFLLFHSGDNIVISRALDKIVAKGWNSLKLFGFVIIQCLSGWLLESNLFAKHYPWIQQSAEISYQWSYVWPYQRPPFLRSLNALWKHVIYYSAAFWWPTAKGYDFRTPSKITLDVQFPIPPPSLIRYNSRRTWK